MNYLIAKYSEEVRVHAHVKSRDEHAPLHFTQDGLVQKNDRAPYPNAQHPYIQLVLLTQVQDCVHHNTPLHARQLLLELLPVSTDEVGGI